MKTFLILLLGTGIVAGLLLRKQSRTASAGVLIGCGVLVILLVMGALIRSCQGSPALATMVSEMNAVSHAMTHELGRYLAEQGAGTRALCVLDPSDSNNDVMRAGLEEGVGGAISIAFVVLEPKLQNEGADMLQLTPAYLDELLKGHPDTDLLICIARMPLRQAQTLAKMLKQRKVRLATGSDALPGPVLGGFQKMGVFAGGAAFRDDPATVESITTASPRELFQANYVLVPARAR